MSYPTLSRSWRSGSAYRGLAIAMLAASSLLTPSARADESTSGLSIETYAESRDQSAGNGFVPADRLRIGEEIFYTLRVQNTSENAIQDAVIVKAMPRNTRYVADSAVGPAARITFSVNGGKSFASPDQLTVTTADGTTRAATTDDYTHIRWQLRHSLAPGATALLRFRGAFK
jgi:uncharacterized repeat protein (TIGR01451 family)